MSTWEHNETKKQATITRYQIEGCRGCGRTYTFRAPVGAKNRNDGAIGRCRQCGATNRTREQVPGGSA